jgi:hypothetical protein
MSKVRPKQAVGLSVKGIKEVTEQLRAMRDVVASEEVARMLGGAADEVRKLAVSNARSQNWPKETLEASFVDARWPQSRRGKRKISVLFGFAKAKHPGYVEWGQGSGPRGKYKVSPPRTFGMNLVTLFEFGGERSVNRVRTWLPARPAFRPALAAARLKARAIVRAKLPEILAAARLRGKTNG